MWPPYRERILITLAVLGIVLAGHLLPLPGAHRLDQVAGWLPFFRPRALTPFALGIEPYLYAAAIWLLVSGAIGRIGRMREGTREERASFDQAIVGIALVIGLAQSIGLVQKLSTFARSGMDPASRVLVVLTYIGGLALLVTTAMLVTRLGIGNGVAWISLLTAHELDRLGVAAKLGTFNVPIVALALAGLVIACRAYLRARQDVALETTENRRPASPGAAPTLPLRFNLVGIVPFLVADAVMLLLFTIASLVGVQLTWILPDSVGYWALQGAIMLLVSYLVAGIGFDTRRVGPLLERYGYRIAGLPPGQSTEEYLDRVIERRIPLSVAALIGILLVPTAVKAATGFDLDRAGVRVTTVLLACAIVIDALRHARGLREIAGGDADEPAAEGDEQETEEIAGDAGAVETDRGVERWVVAFESDTELEARLVIAKLAGNDIRGILLSNRVIPITGTFAFWEWTAPTFPNLAIHRRLGGGSVTVHVPERDAARAGWILDRLPPEAPPVPPRA